MSTSGSGTGIPISGTVAPALGTGVAVPTCLTLVDYARVIEYDEHRFFGVDRQDYLAYQCVEYWTPQQRTSLQHYLSVAQSKMEQELKYPLCPKWIEDEDHGFASQLVTKKKQLISAGVQAIAAIELGSPVDHNSDPAKVGPIATGITDSSEVHIYHPGTDIEIIPQQITINGGNLEAWIPRCRMVKPGQQVGTDPVDYNTLGNFAANVDVKRVYNDASTQAVIVWQRKTGVLGEDTQTAFMEIIDHKVGGVGLIPATYSNGVWTRAGLLKRAVPDQVQINYQAGLTAVTDELRDALIRLAHSLMPAAPCGCDDILRIWKRDRQQPNILDRERLNCPFGLSEGAWIAWRVAQSNREIVLGSA